MIDGKEDTINDIAESITQRKVDITITKSPGNFRAQFILETLDIITLIASDVIGIPA